MNNDANLSFNIKLPYKVRCQIPTCGKAVDRVYKINMDNYSINLCSNDHARLAMTRWEEKKKLGIRPGVPVRKEEPEMVSDNLNEIEENE